MAKQTSSRVLESQPCVFSMLYDPDVWASSPENTDFIDPKMLKDSFKNRFTAPYTFHNYFTLSGLERFCQTGRFAGPYACISVEFSPLVRQKNAGILPGDKPGNRRIYHAETKSASY